MNILFLRFPFRINFWWIATLLIGLYWLTFHYLDVKIQEGEQQYYLILHILSKILFYFVLSIAGCATLSVLISYLIYQFGKRKAFKYILRTKSSQHESGRIVGHIPFYLKPILGKLQAYIWYKDEKLDPTFLYKLPIGKFSIELPVEHIKVYDVKEIDLLFGDFLRMYRIPASVQSLSNFVKHPIENTELAQSFKPQKYDEESIHTEKTIYSPGEWLNYKPFETGDDVRRIVWKMYAKNKELIVRQQELNTHYSSKVEICVSFNLDESIQSILSQDTLQLLLDNYKNEIYSIYKSIYRQNQEVIFQIHGDKKVASLQTVKNSITNAKWIFENDTVELPFQTFLIVPSLIDLEMKEYLSENLKSFSSISIIKLVENLQGYKEKPFWRKLLFYNDRSPLDDSEKYTISLKNKLQLQKYEQNVLEQLT